ncbi:MAG: hypothetical protein M3Z25_01720 [Actinomycetota bacterium]|nr:hypothetical protein [Actinomycetota bacterium]
MSLLLDAGALIAIDRRDRAVAAMLRVAQLARLPVRTSAAVVGQVWRDGARQANLARVLAGVDALDLTLDHGKWLGALLGAAGTADVVDAHVALMTLDGDDVVTSDPDDIRVLLDNRKVRATIVGLS